MARLLLASMLASTAAMNTGDTFTISFHSDADDACAQSLEYEFQMQMYVIQFAVTVMNADNGCLNLQSEYTLNSPGGGQPSSQGGQKYFVGSCVSNTPMSLQYTTEMCDGTPSSLCDRPASDGYVWRPDVTVHLALWPRRGPRRLQHRHLPVPLRHVPTPDTKCLLREDDPSCRLPDHFNRAVSLLRIVTTTTATTRLPTIPSY